MRGRKESICRTEWGEVGRKRAREGEEKLGWREQQGKEANKRRKEIKVGGLFSLPLLKTSYFVAVFPQST
jgi:hypothetical protein